MNADQIQKYYRTLFNNTDAEFFKKYNAPPLVVDAYYRGCALWIWAAQNQNPEKCRALLEGIYKFAMDKKHYSVEEVENELKRLYDLGPEKSYPAIPGFFYEMLTLDKRNGTTASRFIIEVITRALAIFALADDVLSHKDADIITAYCKTMTDICDRENVKPRENGFDLYKYVSENKTTIFDGLVEALAKLDKLEGLDGVKKDISDLVNFIKIRNTRRERGLPTPAMSLHLVFTGNPGTGKTTVARLIAEIYKALGILSKGQLIEVDRSGLVAGYVGQTAIKTQKVLEDAFGGVLFIDEAYSLANASGTDFGRESIDTILKAMDDRREDLIVIAAGYGELMKTFIDANPGLKSRFNKYIEFSDYNGEQLFNIFRIFCNENDYRICENAKQTLREYFDKLYQNRDENFGNARDVRNLFERVITVQSNRIVTGTDLSEDDLVTVTNSDVTNAIHMQ